jgi:hypothetical protein
MGIVNSLDPAGKPSIIKYHNKLIIGGNVEVKLLTIRRHAGVSDWEVFFLFLFLVCTCSFVLLLRVFASSESRSPPSRGGEFLSLCGAHPFSTFGKRIFAGKKMSPTQATNMM